MSRLGLTGRYGARAMQEATPSTQEAVQAAAQAAAEAATRGAVQGAVEGAVQEAPPTPTSPLTDLTPPSQKFQGWIDWISDKDRLELFLEVWAQRLILLVAIVVVFLIVRRIVRRLILRLQKARNLPDAAVLPLLRLVQTLLLVLVCLVILQVIGVPMGVVWASVSTIVGLIAVGFIAVWSVLSNIACSLMLLIFKPFRIGDTIEIVDTAEGPNVSGRVMDLTLMYTVLREERDDGTVNLVQIPNNLLFQRTVRRRAGRHAVSLADHVDKHGLAGREKSPPGDTSVPSGT